MTFPTDQEPLAEEVEAASPQRPAQSSPVEPVVTYAPLPGCPDTSCLCLAAPGSPEQAELFELLNQHRQENGLARLKYSRRLEAAADLHAERMQAEAFFGHIWPDGTGTADRAELAGFCHRSVGENITRGLNRQAFAQDVMALLIQSPEHDANMLLERYRYVGIGFFTVRTSQGREYWWVQLLAVD